MWKNKQNLFGSASLSWDPSVRATLMSEFVRYPTPPSLNYNWSFGFLSGVSLIIQIITGMFLALHYTPHTDFAFDSVEYIMREVNNGWFFRYAHSNGASFMFITVYAHTCRNIYYKTYVPPRDVIWYSGIILLLMLMAIAFMGYVLPWGQMGFWGATVITNIFTTIPIFGPKITTLLWGGTTVGNATLKRFFVLHFILPFFMLALVFLHIYLIHKVGSSNPGALLSDDKVKFYPSFMFKDLVALFIYIFIFITVISWYPNAMGHPDNYIKANGLVTPAHIVPEWYFLPFYAILRSVPSKSLGALIMLLSILTLTFLPKIDRFGPVNDPGVRSIQHKTAFWLFALNLIVLGVLGARPVEEPYLPMASLSTFVFFLMLWVIIPYISLLEAIKLEGYKNQLDFKPTIYNWYLYVVEACFFIKNSILHILISIDWIWPIKVVVTFFNSPLYTEKIWPHLRWYKWVYRVALIELLLFLLYHYYNIHWYIT